VHIRVIDDGQERKPYRAFFSPIADSHGPSGYVSTEAKLSHPDGRREISLQVLARMRSIYESYPLDELAPVIDAIDECRARLIRTEVPA
jgi:hypothetical protein